MIDASGKFQICVGFIIACASFRFRQMTYAKYLMKGSYFQHSEFLLNAFVGLCWVRADLIAWAIHLTIALMFVSVSNVYLSCKSLETLEYYGTFRSKYFFEEAHKWPIERIVQAETCLDIMLGMILIKALEVIEREYQEEEEEEHDENEDNETEEEDDE
ncbi:hypothetical protein GCK72_009844 [Caenorhabditis remanei]|uniref:Uncharacterized protein n=1 Tax=Caenorhabditis remanei TaxID=31234 RepID=A0A6A5H1J2_CAERE|nr:hypothetical protein GCK72_009844 [Caenorhabditis remanei]KAF1761588.1 hypothetical protein GCK72_009844 [Caenorhabditis remanei]